MEQGGATVLSSPRGLHSLARYIPMLEPYPRHIAYSNDVHSWMAAFAAMTSFALDGGVALRAVSAALRLTAMTSFALDGGVALRAVSAALRLAAMTSFAREGLRPLTPHTPQPFNKRKA